MTLFARFHGERQGVSPSRKDGMIADFIGGPWHLCSRTMGEMVSADPPSQIHAVADPKSWGVTLPDGFDMTPKVSIYRLIIITRTFAVYVAQGTPLNQDLYDPVRYFFAREVRFQEEVKGWTQNNADFTAASAEGVRGMLEIQRFRKRKKNWKNLKQHSCKWWRGCVAG